MTVLANTDLEVFPLCLGGNVFGWTADEGESFDVLDSYVRAGGNFLDTADSYTDWIPGNCGGESEGIIGRWIASRGNRDQLVVATKVGNAQAAEGLAPSTIRKAVEGSLRRLQTDHIDLYYAHRDDPNTPLEETLGAFDALVREGKVRYVAASNYSAPRLEEALAVSDRSGLARYAALQTHYNLVEREQYEGELADVCQTEGLPCLSYFGLASGFLTGKYRLSDAQPGSSPRAEEARAYLNERGIAVLATLDEIAAEHGTTDAAVALAWLMGRPTVAAVIASARNATQLAGLLPSVQLELSGEERDRLTSVTAF